MVDKMPSARIHVTRDINELDIGVSLKGTVCDGSSCCAFQISIPWGCDDDIIDEAMGHQ